MHALEVATCSLPRTGTPHWVPRTGATAHLGATHTRCHTAPPHAVPHSGSYATPQIYRTAPVLYTWAHHALRLRLRLGCHRTAATHWVPRTRRARTGCRARCGAARTWCSATLQTASAHWTCHHRTGCTHRFWDCLLLPWVATALGATGTGCHLGAHTGCHCRCHALVPPHLGATHLRPACVPPGDLPELRATLISPAATHWSRHALGPAHTACRCHAPGVPAHLELPRTLGHAARTVAHSTSATHWVPHAQTPHHRAEAAIHWVATCTGCRTARLYAALGATAPACHCLVPRTWTPRASFALSVPPPGLRTHKTTPGHHTLSSHLSHTGCHCTPALPLAWVTAHWRRAHWVTHLGTHLCRTHQMGARAGCHLGLPAWVPRTELPRTAGCRTHWVATRLRRARLPRHAPGLPHRTGFATCTGSCHRTQVPLHWSATHTWSHHAPACHAPRKSPHAQGCTHWVATLAGCAALGAAHCTGLPRTRLPLGRTRLGATCTGCHTGCHWVPHTWVPHTPGAPPPGATHTVPPGIATHTGVYTALVLPHALLRRAPGYRTLGATHPGLPLHLRWSCRHAQDRRTHGALRTGRRTLHVPHLPGLPHHLGATARVPRWCRRPGTSRTLAPGRRTRSCRTHTRCHRTWTPLHWVLTHLERSHAWCATHLVPRTGCLVPHTWVHARTGVPRARSPVTPRWVPHRWVAHACT
ncbi:hypothetical protein GPJ56_004553 [Histomonas meleagridis]|nr:hypothetical protein GPJ56_004553 [Histomonas meleagridis]